MEPASIRYKNPGAMWGNALARKWGAAEKAVTLQDGKGQGNNIAVFPTYVQGICAQMDLWMTSPHYKNKSFEDAIRVWSGGNSVDQYIKFVTDRTPGMSRHTVMDALFWRSDMAVPFLKAQAWHEAGKQYPAPEADWIEARRRVLGQPASKPAQTSKPSQAPKPTAPAVVGTGVWAAALAYFEHHRWQIAAAGVLAVLGYLGCRYIQSRRRKEAPPTRAAIVPVDEVQSLTEPQLQEHTSDDTKSGEGSTEHPQPATAGEANTVPPASTEGATENKQ